MKDVGKVVVFDARPPFAILKTLDTGPITNHVNFARNANGTFAYVTVGCLNVNALGPIRQIVQGEDVQRRYLVIVAGTAEKHGNPVQIQAPASTVSK